MVQEGGLRAIGGVTELSDLSVVWDDGGTVVGKSGWTDESSVLDVSTIGTVYLEDPDKLSLIAKRKHIWHQGLIFQDVLSDLELH